MQHKAKFCPLNNCLKDHHERTNMILMAPETDCGSVFAGLLHHQAMLFLAVMGKLVCRISEQEEILWKKENLMQVIVMHKKLEKCVEKYAWFSNLSVMSLVRNEWTLEQLLIMILYCENYEKYFWNLDPICLPGLRSCSKQISNKWLFTTSVILFSQLSW